MTVYNKIDANGGAVAKSASELPILVIVRDGLVADVIVAGFPETDYEVLDWDLCQNRRTHRAVGPGHAAVGR